MVSSHKLVLLFLSSSSWNCFLVRKYILGFLEVYIKNT